MAIFHTIFLYWVLYNAQKFNSLDNLCFLGKVKQENLLIVYDNSALSLPTQSSDKMMRWAWYNQMLNLLVQDNAIGAASYFFLNKRQGNILQISDIDQFFNKYLFTIYWVSITKMLLC